MELVRWERSRAFAKTYRPRKATSNALYRLVYYYHEELELVWQERFQQSYGAYRAEVREAFERYLSCGVLAHGCARARCESCNHSILIAYSCKRRSLCPSCDAKRGTIFAEHLHENVLLSHPHRHVVFSLPKRLRLYFRYDRSLLGGIYHAAWGAWQDACGAGENGTRAGAVMSLHTAGDLLNFHPHIHGIFLDGVVLDDGAYKSFDALDRKRLEECFRERVFEFLKEKQLIDEEVISNMKSWEHSGFNVWLSEPIAAEEKERRLYLASYLKKCPVSLNRLEVEESGSEVQVRYHKKTDLIQEHRVFTPLEFLAELSSHLPNTWEQTSRYYGCYASRTRGAGLSKLVLEAESTDVTPAELACEEEPREVPSTHWAAMMKRVFEIEPLTCPKCGDEMKIKAFLHSEQEIKRIAGHLGYTAWRAPPPFTSKSSGIDIDYGPEFKQDSPDYS